MRYDPSDRIFSLSFARDPEEHADAMMEAGRKLVTRSGPASVWRPFFVMIGGGIAIGLAMEFYRGLVLPALLGTTDVTPLPVVLLELLPVALVVGVLIAAYVMRAGIRQQRAIVARLDPKIFVDIDILRQGLRISSGPMLTEMDWTGVRDIVAAGNRLDIETEAYVIYVPERAFANRAAFNEAAGQIRTLWREARRNEHDSRMIAAGLD